MRNGRNAFIVGNLQKDCHLPSGLLIRAIIGKIRLTIGKRLG
jgi:hypothetical protein